MAYFYPMRFTYIPFFFVVALLILVLAVAGYKSGKEDLALPRELIAIRMIGHDVLLHAGDSTSRVLPVKQLSENEYQLQFEDRFSFEPDSLVKIVHRVITVHHLPSDYIVNVINCAGREVIYGYAMSTSEQNNIVPCRGRKQLKRCYYITIQFPHSGRDGFQKKYIIAIAGLLALTFSWWRLRWYNKGKRASGRPPEGQPEPSEGMPLKDKPIQMGKFLFYPGEQYLSLHEEKTVLTMKETALLSIFAVSPNQVIERSRLQKEIWEDEGVIVGRSLDMFVSRLRKKLEVDPAVRIVNIHGKGYKLEVNG